MSGLGKQGEHLSIMIPYYNGKKTIAQTIESLKIQAEDIVNAQIQILDDASTDSSEEYVRNLWPERVLYTRNPKNIGLVPGFNACLERAERPFVHILHQDDVVLYGAYREFDTSVKLVEEQFTPLAVFSRSIHANAELVWRVIENPLRPGLRGRLNYDPADWRTCPMQFVGTLLSRSVRTELGGFDTRMPYCPDFLLWWQIARTERCVYSNTVTGVYRLSDFNETSRLQKQGIAMQDELNVLRRIADTLKETGLGSLTTEADLYRQKWFDSVQLLHRLRGDDEAFARNLAVLRTFPPEVQDRREISRFYLSRWKRRVLGRKP